MVSNEGPAGPEFRYAFGDSDAAVKRLSTLSQVFETPSRAILAAVDAGAVDTAIDLGCGPGYSTRLVSTVVRPRLVVGLDFSEAFLEHARVIGPVHALWQRHDITTIPFPMGPADLLYARLVLAHVARPQETLLAWLGQLRPDGHLVIEETEWVSAEHPILTAYEEMASALVAHHGGDLYVGRHLDDFEAPSSYRRLLNRRYHHRVGVPTAAGLFAMNFAIWRTDSWIVEHHSARALDIMAADLARLAESNEGGQVTFAIRQLAYRFEPGGPHLGRWVRHEW